MALRDTHVRLPSLHLLEVNIANVLPTFSGGHFPFLHIHRHFFFFKNFYFLGDYHFFLKPYIDFILESQTENPIILVFNSQLSTDKFLGYK